MLRIWKNIKAFFENVKKLYRLAKMVTFDDSDNTIIFNGNLEAVIDVRAGKQVVCYYDDIRHPELHDERIKAARAKGYLSLGQKEV